MISTVTTDVCGNDTLKLHQNTHAPSTFSSAILHRNVHAIPAKVVSSKSNYLYLENGRKIFDATGGAAVACIGHGNEAVKTAVAQQMDQVSYCALFSSSGAENLAQALVDSTNGAMAKAYIVSSGKAGKSTHSSGPTHRMNRLRGHGGCHEACTAIFPGAVTIGAC